MNGQKNMGRILLSLNITETTVYKRAKFKIKYKFGVFKLTLKQIIAYFDLDQRKFHFSKRYLFVVPRNVSRAQGCECLYCPVCS